jgi:hypothetical protein
MDPLLKMLLHSIEASNPPTNFQEIAAQEYIRGIPIGDQLAVWDAHMMDILKAAPRHRNNEINTDVVLPCPIVTAQTDDEKRQHRNTLAIGYARKARQKKKDHQHNMAVEFLALQEENKQLRTQINAILGLSYSTPQIKHLSTPY